MLMEDAEFWKLMMESKARRRGRKIAYYDDDDEVDEVQFEHESDNTLLPVLVGVFNSKPPRKSREEDEDKETGKLWCKIIFWLRQHDSICLHFRNRYLLSSSFLSSLP